MSENIKLFFVIYSKMYDSSIAKYYDECLHLISLDSYKIKIKIKIWLNVFIKNIVKGRKKKLWMKNMEYKRKWLRYK